VNLTDSSALTINTVGGTNNLTTNGAGGITLTDTNASGITTTATNGGISAGNNPVVLQANAMTFNGAVSAGTSTMALTANVGGISEATTSAITTALLTGSALGSVNLAGTTNAITALGVIGTPFNDAGQAFSLTDASALTVNGVTANTVALTAPSFTIPGALTGTTSVGLTANIGGMTESGSVTTALLTGGATANVALTGTNVIPSIGPFTVTGGSFSLTDTGSFAFNGAVSATNVTATTGGTGAIAVNTTVAAAPTGGTLTLVSGSGGIAVNGGATLSGATVDLTTSGGGVTEASSGTIATGLMQSPGGVVGAVALPGLGNAIASIGNFTVLAGSGTFGLFTTGPLTVSGTLNAQSVSLEATGNISIPGAVVDPPAGSVTLVSDNGSISETGTLIAALLTGNAAGTVDLAGATPTINQVATLGNFTANGSFILNDGVNLLLNGVVSAATININDGTNTISLGNGGFNTSGANRPPGSLLASQLPPNSITTQGAYLSAGSVIQTGSSFTVNNPYSTQESILSIALPTSGGGTLQFSSSGLDAPSTWLILSVGNGQAGGPINVKALDFVYAPPPGRANFTGSIDGLNGQAAAAAAFIEPQPNANFRVNGCPIHSINCVLLATQSIPATPPLTEIIIGAPFNPQNTEDLVLPVVSDERYEMLPCNGPNPPQGCVVETQPMQH